MENKEKYKNLPLPVHSKSEVPSGHPDKNANSGEFEGDIGQWSNEYSIAIDFLGKDAYKQLSSETTHKQQLQRLINNSGYFITTLPTVENLPEILPPE